MTEKLDQHAPTAERLSSIRHHLLRAGISEEAIPNDWVAATMAAMEKWMLTTEEGLKYASEIFKFELKKAEDTKQYLLIDNINRTTYELKNSQVWFYKGCIVNGMPISLADSCDKNYIPPYELDISEIDKTKCESCGIVSHCTKEVIDPIADDLQQLCNFCLTYHEHPRVNELGGDQICRQCSLVKCTHHPNNTKVLKYS